MAKKRLGIDALFQTSVPSAEPAPPVNAPPDEVNAVETSRLVPGSRQPRGHFDEAALGDLADSVREHGVLQPILVRPGDGGTYEIVAGERRWRAARAAGLERVPVRVLDIDDAATLAVAMVENLQREDLNPLEEAEGYLELLRMRLEGEAAYARYADADDPRAGVVRLLRAMNNRAAGNTKDNAVLSLESAVAEVFDGVGRIGWSSFVAHRLPLLTLPDDVRSAIRTNGLPYTKARVIARVVAAKLGGDEGRARRLRRDLIEQAVTEGASVRSLQAEVARTLDATPRARRGRERDLTGRIAELKARLEALDAVALSSTQRDRLERALDDLFASLDG